MSYRPNFIGPDYIAPCPRCGRDADLAARWKVIGSAPAERLYVFVLCQEGACQKPGGCFKEPADALDDWNKAAAPRKRKARK